MTSRLPILAAALILASAVPAPAAQPVSIGPVTLVQQPGTALDATARRVAAADIEEGGTGALLLLGSQYVGPAATGPALFVQVQSERACGSAGCSVSVYLPTGAGWRKVLDVVSGSVLVEAAQHGGMHDLVVNKTDRWVWNGRVYADTLPAPQVDLRPRHGHGAATRTRSQANP